MIVQQLMLAAVLFAAVCVAQLPSASIAIDEDHLKLDDSFETILQEPATREKRAASFTLLLAENCKISRQEMNIVAGLLIKKLKGESKNTPLFPVARELDACQESMQDVMTTASSVHDLKDKIYSLENSTTHENYKSLQKELHGTINKFEVQMERVHQQAAPDAILLIQRVVDEKDALKTALEKKLQEVHVPLIEPKGGLLAMAASDIDGGNFDFAVQKYLQVTDGFLVELIKNAYKLEKPINVMQFIEKLPCPIHQAKAYIAFVNETLAANDTGTFVVVIHGSVLELKRRDTGHYISADLLPVLDEIERMLERPVQVVLNSWAELIRTKNYSEILTFSYMYQRAFSNVLYKLVETVGLRNNETLEALFTFAEDLPTPEFSAKAYSAMFDSLDNDIQSILRLLRGMYNVNNLRDSLYIDRSEINLMWQILTGEEVCICAGDFCLLNSGRVETDRVLFFAGNKVNYVPAKWLFKIDEVGGRLVFTISNSLDLSELFYAENEKMDDQQRRVYVSRNVNYPTEGKLWELQSDNWKSGEFYLYNVYYREYLTYENNGGNTQYAYTCVNDANCPPMPWKISACS